jgi:hypothetical protein
MSSATPLAGSLSPSNHGNVSSNSRISSGAIGGIVGGIVGGFVVMAIFLWMLIHYHYMSKLSDGNNSRRAIESGRVDMSEAEVTSAPTNANPSGGLQVDSHVPADGGRLAIDVGERPLEDVNFGVDAGAQSEET